METELVTCRISLTGFFDTGSTLYHVALAKHTYDPGAEVGRRLSDREELLLIRGERFLTEGAQDDITRYALKAIDHYATRMLLP